MAIIPPLKLTRDQLASFLQDFEQIKQFENLFATVQTLAPIVGTDFEYQADTAAASANEALAQIVALRQIVQLLALAPEKTITLTHDVAGVLPVRSGGTGVPTLTGVVKASGTTPFTAGTVDLATEVSGTLPVANGGTGQTSYVNGELLIGNTTGNTLTKATLTAGANITITNSTGSITIAVSGLGTMAFENIGASGSFTTADIPPQTVTVVNGIITSIV
jgi:hypothetical protein